MSDDGINRETLLRIFLAEAEENLATMEDSLLVLEKSPNDDELINTIFRASHTLRGNCATVGLDTLVTLTHAAEDLLDGLRSHRLPATNELITLLLRSTDSLKDLIPLAVARPDAPPMPDDAIVGALKEAAQSAIGAVDHLTQSNASAAEKLESTAEELTAQAQSLQQMVSFFRLEGTAPAAATSQTAHEPLRTTPLPPRSHAGDRFSSGSEERP